MTIRGCDGQTLDQYWNKEGGPMAYLGTCIPVSPSETIVGEASSTEKVTKHQYLTGIPKLLHVRR
jgi:hypothetical protein